MAKVRDQNRYKNVPGWLPVTDDFGRFRGYHFVEDVRHVFMREATPEEKDALEIDLEWLERHVTVDEDTGCWVWNGYVTKGGQPQARFTLGPFVHATMLVRRLVARMRLGGPNAIIQNGNTVAKYMRSKQCAAKETCLRGCCHPDHVLVRSKKQAMKKSRGKPLPLSQKAAISRTKRARSKVSEDDIQRILASNEPAYKLSLELGMDPSYASKVRRGNIGIYQATGGLFTGLLASSNGANYGEAA